MAGGPCQPLPARSRVLPCVGVCECVGGVCVCLDVWVCVSAGVGSGGVPVSLPFLQGQQSPGFRTLTRPMWSHFSNYLCEDPTSQVLGLGGMNTSFWRMQITTQWLYKFWELIGQSHFSPIAIFGPSTSSLRNQKFLLSMH